MSYYDFENHFPKIHNPNMKHFDLCVGDRVKHTYSNGSGNLRKLNVDFWTVTAIYPHVFMVENRWGEKTTFTKTEYEMNILVKVREDESA